jgi:hypothetical protein
MRAIAKGIFNPENQKAALTAADQIKKYAQAGDISVGKQDRKSLAAILAKVSGLVDDFLDALSDVPDEI